MTALALLNQMAFEAKCKQYPDVPPEFMNFTRYKVNSANSLTKAIKAFLILKGHQCERISTTGRPIDRRQTFTDSVGFRRQIGTIKWIPGTSTRGSSDLSSIIHGRSVKIEIKWKRDVQSEAQKQYQQSVERAGGTYIIVRDFDSFLDWYNDFTRSSSPA